MMAEPGAAVVCWEDNDNRGHTVPRAQKFARDGAVATGAFLIDFSAASDHVDLDWDVAALRGADFSVSRQAAKDSPWLTLASVQPDGSGRIRYRDASVTPGATYSYRLDWRGAGNAGSGTPTQVHVPGALRFALAGARPNPAPAANLRISFTLAVPGAATLDVHDLAGRRVAGRSFTGLEAGEHSEAIAGPASLRAGIYWVRLHQGAQEAKARIVVVN